MRTTKHAHTTRATRLTIPADFDDYVSEFATHLRAKVQIERVGDRVTVHGDPCTIGYLRAAHKSLRRCFREERLAESAEERHFQRLNKLAAEFMAIA